MTVKCSTIECAYNEDYECGIVKDGIDTLEIGTDGECICFEFKEEDGEQT